MKVRAQTKFILAFLSVVLVGACLAGLILNSAELQFFISNSRRTLLVRSILTAATLTYLLLPGIRFRLVKHCVALIGAAALIFGVVGLVSPTYLGLAQTYVLPLDTFIFIEGGICMILASLELPRRQSDARHASTPFATSLAANARQ